MRVQLPSASGPTCQQLRRLAVARADVTCRSNFKNSDRLMLPLPFFCSYINKSNQS
jgi:hypothetical protein